MVGTDDKNYFAEIVLEIPDYDGPDEDDHRGYRSASTSPREENDDVESMFEHL